MCVWIPHTRAAQKAGRPARTYIQQLCEDTGCCPEDLPRAMNDREEWREVAGISVLPARYDDDDDYIYKMRFEIIYLINTYKTDLALNYLRFNQKFSERQALFL